MASFFVPSFVWTPRNWPRIKRTSRVTISQNSKSVRAIGRSGAGLRFAITRPSGKNIPTDWDVDSGKNIKWKAKLGSQTYSGPVVANGKVYVGTNNAGGYIERFPWNDFVQVDLGVLLCFDEQTGEFLWQHSNKKLKTGRKHDWPMQGIVSVPLIDGERLWYVTNRGEVVCLDTEGFRDKENDGPFQQEDVEAENEADVVWKFDMMGELGISQHNMCTCSLTSAGEILFVVTSNGVDESHVNIPKPNAPAFFAMNKHTAEVLWTDESPNKGLLHGSWSSPAYAVLGGRPQVLFPGGDGWLYSFDPQGDGRGHSKLLWKFDCNPKEAKWILGGRGNRNPYITAAGDLRQQSLRRHGSGSRARRRAGASVVHRSREEA